jgi:hypothetical protein
MERHPGGGIDSARVFSPRCSCEINSVLGRHKIKIWPFDIGTERGVSEFMFLHQLSRQARAK